jgi:hypothetical protein
MFKVLTIEELAEDAFVKSEYVKALGMANTPNDYDERKKAFVAMAVARDAANVAEKRLRDAMHQQATPKPPRSGPWPQ